MKNISNFLFLLMVIMFVCGTSLYPQWFTQSPLPTGNNLLSVSFVNANVGTAVGALGTIVRTTDGGTTWEIQTSGVPEETLNGVSFTDANTGTAVGSTGTILRTIDGGSTWTSQTSGTTNQLNGVFFTDANTGTAVGATGTILRTTDGGLTWIPQTSGVTVALRAVHFTDANTGTAVGASGTIRRTTDGGATWTAQTSGVTVVLRAVYFTDMNTGTVVGATGNIRRTTDGGTTWTGQSSGTTIQLNGVSFSNANIGTVMGGAIILRTTDGGTTWDFQNSGASNTLNGISFTDANTGTMVGNLGTIIRTTDGGVTWTAQSSGVNSFLYGVSFADADTGTVVGASGTIARTIDGGNTWSYQISGTTNQLNGVFFTDANTGTAVGASGTILRTTDGGSNWFLQTSGTTNQLNEVFFTDANTGTVVGHIGTILRTTNGGSTWTPQTSGTTSPILAVYFTDTNIGSAVGFVGLTLRTTDGGSTWAISSGGAGNTLNDVFFTNTDTGTVVGNSGKIFRTIDGGTTWTSQNSGTTNYLYGVSFSDDNNGWVVGASGTILRTTNGGISWINQTSGTTNQLNEVSFTDAMTGTVVGHYGTILRTTNGGGVILPLAPTNLSAISATSSSIDLTWTDNSDNEDGFKIERKDGGIGSGNPFVLIDSVGANVTAYTNTGLNSNATYTYRVFAYNVYGGSNYSNLAEATTFCEIVTAPFTEDFEVGSFPPDCWTAGENIWVSSGSGISGYGIGSYSAKGDFYNVSTGSDNLISGDYDASGLTNPVLKFDWAYATYAGGAIDTLKVYYSTDAGTTWILIVAMYDGAPGSSNLNPHNLSSFDEYGGISFPVEADDWSTGSFPLLSGTNKVKFTAITDYGNNLFVDNIKIEQAPAHDIGVTALARNYDTLIEGLVETGFSREIAKNSIDKNGNRIENVSIRILYPEQKESSPESTVNLLAIVENFGGAVENSYQVGWQIDGTPQTSVSNTQPLEVGDIDTLTLTWATATGGSHSARAWSILGTDANAANDTSGIFSFFICPDNSIYCEQFEQGLIPPTGWVTYNQDGGTATPWFVGNPNIFPAYEGSGYIGNNYQRANGFFIDDWLVTSNTGGIPLENSMVDSLVFWMRSPDGSTYPDSVEIRLSTTGQAVGDFTVLLDYFKVPTTGWTRFAYALPTAANRYIAFRYLMYDGGVSGNSSDYIGLDLVQILRYEITNTFQLSVNVADGWNMVSVPGVNPNGQGVESWWPVPNRIGDVYEFSGGYQVVTTTTPGIGYWMKNNGAQTYNTGDEWPAGGIQIVAHDPLAGASGWNLFGGYELVVTAANVTTNPTGLQSGPIYKYSGGYQTATTLDPGYGYWIKLNAAGQIIIPETMSKGEVVEYFQENWGRIILTDATGINYTLYAVKGEVNLDNYELPPTPPTGMFDIRFSSGRIAEDINSSVKTIDMSGVTYPLTVRVEGMDIRLMDETAKTINVNLKAGEDVVVENSMINKLMVSGELIPTVYSLEQNYPNPFNPSTVIEFSLPDDATNVKLSIYNALGEKVAELVNTALTAGKYQYQWNARDVATGMYIYELRTDKFVSVKKMLLLK